MPVKYLTLFGTIPWGAVCVTPALHAIQYIFSLFWVSVPSRSPPRLVEPCHEAAVVSVFGYGVLPYHTFPFFFFFWKLSNGVTLRQIPRMESTGGAVAVYHCQSAGDSHCEKL